MIPLLQVKNLSKQLPKGLLIDNINLQQEPLQKLAIAGISGAGKTSLLKMIAGLLQPDAGSILLNGKRVPGPYEQLLPGHKQIGYLSQGYELRNNYKVADLIWFDNKLAVTEATEIFEVCNNRHLLSRRTDELSGGEKQRIGLCLLLVKKPALLILDEPFSNLDLIHKNILKVVLNDISSQLQTTILLASHDPLDTLSWANEIAVMQEGKIIQQANPKHIYNQPNGEYVAALFGYYNLLTVSQIQLITNNAIVKNKNQTFILRPEFITIVNLEKAVCKGQVTTINFYGNYYLATVLVDSITLTVMQATNKVSVGDIVGLLVDTDKLIPF